MNKLLRFFLIAFAIFLGFTSEIKAQLHFNHTTIYVVDLAKSSQFYESVLKLKKIAEPFHDNRHTWFEIAPHCQLHVVSGQKELIAHDINIHLAFSVDNLDEVMARLRAAKVKFGNWAGSSEAPQLRPDGIQQIYLQDPDGYWIEINNDKY